MVPRKRNSVLYIWNITNIHKLKTVSVTYLTMEIHNPKGNCQLGHAVVVNRPLKILKYKDFTSFKTDWRSCHNGRRQETWHSEFRAAKTLVVATDLYTGSQRSLSWNLTGYDWSLVSSVTNSCLLTFIIRGWLASALCRQTPPPLMRHTDHLSAVVDLNTTDLILILQSWIKLNHHISFMFNPSVFRKTWLQQINSWFHSLEISMR